MLTWAEWNDKFLEARAIRLDTWRCPCCVFSSQCGRGSRTCPDCGYTGDWVQPGELRTYAEQTGKMLIRLVRFQNGVECAWTVFTGTVEKYIEDTRTTFRHFPENHYMVCLCNVLYQKFDGEFILTTLYDSASSDDPADYGELGV